MNNHSWLSDAACKGADTDLFFGSILEQNEAKRRYCDNCPVTEQCLLNQLDWEAVHCRSGLFGPTGLFGGRHGNARRKLITTLPGRFSVHLGELQD